MNYFTDSILKYLDPVVWKIIISFFGLSVSNLQIPATATFRIKATFLNVYKLFWLLLLFCFFYFSLNYSLLMHSRFNIITRSV